MSRARAMRAGWAWLAAALFLGAPVAQDADQLAAGLADFDRCFGQAAADQDPEQRSAAARRGVRAFLRLPPEAEARQLRLARAAELAFLGGDFERSRQWVAEALGLGASADEAARLRALGWRATLLQAGGDAALEACHADRDMVSTEVSAAFLVEAQMLERGVLFEAAQRRLRLGTGEDAALWALRSLAAAVTTGPLETIQQRFGAALALGNLALAERQRGDVDAAEVAYRRAVELYDADAILWNDYAMLLRGVRRDDEAVAALRRSIEAEAAPGDGPGVMNLGLLYRLRGGRGLPAGFREAVTKVSGGPHEAAAEDAAAGLTAELADAYGVLLARRPEQALVRRMLVDLVVPRQP